MKTEDLIADEFQIALEDLSDKNLESLRTAFESGPIREPRKLITYIFKEVIDQIRYRSIDGIE